MREIIDEIVAVLLMFLLGFITWALLAGLLIIAVKL
jgi:hypothetical protein